MVCAATCTGPPHVVSFTCGELRPAKEAPQHAVVVRAGEEDGDIRRQNRHLFRQDAEQAAGRLPERRLSPPLPEPEAPVGRHQPADRAGVPSGAQCAVPLVGLLSHHHQPGPYLPVARVSLEVVVVTVADAIAAEEGGADRLELVANLPEGGVTPSAGVIAAVRRATRLPLYVMIRPRGGSFHFSPAEVDAMVEDARIARELGADGLVIGALTPQGAVDHQAMLRVLNAARLPATFHRAFESISRREDALQQVASLPYVERILTSGGAPRPEEALDALREVIAKSPLEIMVGGGVTLANAAMVLRETGAAALHTGTAVREPAHPTAPVSAALVAEMRHIIDEASVDR